MLLCLWMTGPQRHPLVNPQGSLGWYFASFIGYLFCVWLVFRIGRQRYDWRLPVLIALFAVLLRAVALSRFPNFSTDIFRYVWDGKMTNLGINPYLYAPLDEMLVSYRDGLWSQINHKDVSTIYPPFAQMVFAGLYRLAPDSTLVFRTFFALVDLGTVGLIALLLRQFGRAGVLCVAYAWHPLPITEFAAAGHVDALGIFLLAAALLAWAKKRHASGGVLFALSVMSKGFSLLALPFLIRGGKTKFAIGFLAAGALCTLPFVGANKALFQGLKLYSRYWEVNPSLYLVIKNLLPSTPIDDRLVARLVGGAILVVLLALVLIKAKPEKYSLGRSMTFAQGALLLLGPTVFPWYLCWLAMLANIFFVAGFWLWTITGSLHYVRMFLDPAQSLEWLYLEYIPVYAILLWEIVRSLRRTKTGGTSTVSTEDMGANKA